MPSPIQNRWTLKKLIQNTYKHMRSRFDYKLRDMIRIVRIEEVSVYDGKNPGQARTRFDIISRSVPQYWPYFTVKDSRGRKRTKQLKFRHDYDVIIQLERLSLNVPFKGRTGRAGKPIMSKQGFAHKVNGRVVEGANYKKKGINLDFFFRSSYVWEKEGILFGKNFAKSAPAKANPKKIVFADKHMLAVIQYLMRKGILKND